MIKSAIACNLDTYVLRAALPLFAEEEVEAIEWSFDTLHQTPNIPIWFGDLLRTFSAGQALIGHGVFFSLFTGRWSANQNAWLKHLQKVSRNFQFQHITEHFGFMTGMNFHQGAPISIPLTPATLAIGQDRLQRIYQACQCPVGLENLAFTYSLEEVKRHGDFLEKLIEPVNGFIILDLHNLYCQIHNFQISFADIIKYYPLHRVREIHISGGSWQASDLAPEQRVRRDTHDDGVPAEVFELLKKAIPICPELKYVVMEQIGTGLKTEAEQVRFRTDYQAMKAIVDEQNEKLPERIKANFLPAKKIELAAPVTNEKLYEQQMALSAILENAEDYKTAAIQLQNSMLAGTEWKVEEWSPHMLSAVVEIAQKWKHGFKKNPL